ncbi:MAG: metal ABC transporter permease [Kiritimatiellae bacterium]|nr:metal ABC transporter permease [Kiritimatiellia bacterium]
MPDVLVQPLLAALLAAVAAGPVGALALVRRDTYAAAAISHGCFAGLGLARWLSVACGLAWFTPTLGATLAAVAAALFLALSPAARPGRNDAALSALWAVGMAAGLAFLAATPGYAGSLQDYLFGSILFVSRADLRTMLAFDLALLAALAFFWRGLFAVAFGPRLAALRGAPAKFYGAVLSLLTALAVVLLVRAVGIVLVVALLALPALAARPLVRRLVPLMALSGVFAFVSLAAGLFASWRLDCTPSVPAVFAAALLALLARLAPRRR